MVQINLLPPTKKKKAKVKIELKINLKPLIFILISVMLLIMVVWSMLGMRLKAKEGELTQLDKELNTSKTTLQKLDNFKKDKEQLLSRLEFMDKQLQRKILWAKNLNYISNLIPEGIWLKSIILQAKKEAGLVKYVRLDIDGLAISLHGEEMIDSIGRFMTALKQDEVFAPQFAEIRLISSQRSKSGRIEAMDFKLNCHFR